MPTDRLRSVIAADLPALVKKRRHLHQTPELTDTEHIKSGFIQAELASMGIWIKAGLGNKGTGIVAHITPSDPEQAGRAAIGVRADIGALPIAEGTGKGYT